MVATLEDGLNIDNELLGWFCKDNEGLHLGRAVAVRREGSMDGRELQDLMSSGILGMEKT